MKSVFLVIALFALNVQAHASLVAKKIQIVLVPDQTTGLTYSSIQGVFMYGTTDDPNLTKTVAVSYKPTSQDAANATTLFNELLAAAKKQTGAQ